MAASISRAQRPKNYARISGFVQKNRASSDECGLTIGRLAAAAGVDLETVRYYERIKLMPPPARTASGHRAYEEAHVRRLAFIRRGRELGFSIEQIRTLLALAEPARASSCVEVREIAPARTPEIIEINLYGPGDAAKVLEEVRIAALGNAPVKLVSGESITVDFGYKRFPLGAFIKWGGCVMSIPVERRICNHHRAIALSPKRTMIAPGGSRNKRERRRRLKRESEFARNAVANRRIAAHERKFETMPMKFARSG